MPRSSSPPVSKCNFCTVADKDEATLLLLLLLLSHLLNYILLVSFEDGVIKKFPLKSILRSSSCNLLEIDVFISKMVLSNKKCVCHLVAFRLFRNKLFASHGEYKRGGLTLLYEITNCCKKKRSHYIHTYAFSQRSNVKEYDQFKRI